MQFRSLAHIIAIEILLRVIKTWSALWADARMRYLNILVKQWIR